jgi:phosphoenolpyruvate phosphomutase
MTKAALLRQMFDSDEMVYTVGAHNGLGAALAARAGFHAVWASSFEISAARALPDAGLLGMSDFLEAARQINDVCPLPVIADCDTGFGNELNMAHTIRQFEAAGVAAVCIEDKVFPKLNSFAGRRQHLVPVEEFQRKIRVAKLVQESFDTIVIARTEALIAGEGLVEALSRAHAYADAGADAVLIHSKSKSPEEVESFLAAWQRRVPAVVVPTTYHSWSAREAHERGASMVIYANQGLRASVAAMSRALTVIRNEGSSDPLESEIATVKEIFALQGLDEWMALER